MELNLKKFFTDKQVRRAIAYTIPVDDIIEVMLDGKAQDSYAEYHLKKELIMILKVDSI